MNIFGKFGSVIVEPGDICSAEQSNFEGRGIVQPLQNRCLGVNSIKHVKI
jgi:hypothetical protein